MRTNVRMALGVMNRRYAEIVGTAKPRQRRVVATCSDCGQRRAVERWQGALNLCSDCRAARESRTA